MMIDIDDGRICENIRIIFEGFTDTIDISTITDENCIKFYFFDF